MSTRPLIHHKSFLDSETGSGAGWDWQEVLDHCHGVARRCTPYPDVAEDAAQEAVARAWRARDGCRRQADPRPWLSAIVRREVIRIMSRRIAQSEVPIDRVPEPAEECAVLAGTDDRATVAAALATLTPADRRVLLLRYGGDMTQPAIAQALAMPEGTVKIRLHRARARLREVMDDGPGGVRPHTAAARGSGS